jgi:hypothetical protein
MTYGADGAVIGNMPMDSISIGPNQLHFQLQSRLTVTGMRTHVMLNRLNKFDTIFVRHPFSF